MRSVVSAFGAFYREAFSFSRFYTLISRGIVVVIGVVALVPLVYLLVRAADAGPEILTYLGSPRLLAAVGRSLALMLGVIAGATLLGIPFAWLTSRTDLPYQRVWLALGVLPMVMPTYLIAVTFSFAFGPRGLLQKLLEPLFGITRLPSIYGLFGTWLVLTLCTFPYIVLPLRAHFRRVTPLLEEAAADLGANRWHTFWRVMLPQCRPALVAGMILVGLYSLSDFGASAIMRYENFTQAIYLQYTSSFNRAQGAVLALMLVLVIILLLLVEQFAAWKPAHTAHITTGTPSFAGVVRLGRWRFSAIAFCTLVVGLGVGTPLVILLHWLTTRTAARFVDYNPLELVANTVGLSAAAALMSGLIAIPFAAITWSSNTFVRRLLGRLPYLGYVLPGMVIGLAMVFFATRYLPNLYQTLPVLIAAYVMRFLPISIGTTGSAFAQVNTRLQETAQSLGAREWHVLWRITLPLSWSGIGVGMVLVFLGAMKELPIVLMLAPTGFHTLSYRIWSAYQEAIFSQIGLPGLMLMATSALSVIVILRGER